MAYQIADMHNGPFSEIVDTLEEAEALLAECIKEGQEISDSNRPHGHEVLDDEPFFVIVDAETGEEV